MNNKKLVFFLILAIVIILLAVSGILFIISRFYANLLILDLISYVIANLTLILILICFSAISVFIIINAFVAHKIRNKENLFFLDILNNIRSQSSQSDLLNLITSELKRVFSGNFCCYYSFNKDENEFTLVLPENNDHFTINISDDICKLHLNNETHELFKITDLKESVEFEANENLYIVFPVHYDRKLSGLLIVSEIGISIKDAVSINEFSLTAVKILGLSVHASQISNPISTPVTLGNTYLQSQISSIIDKEIERADRFQNNLSVVSVSIDPQMIDKFSILPDSQIYSDFLNIISHAVRSFDYLFFLDEQERFLLILPQSASKQALELCERVNDEISKKNFYIPLIDKKESLTLYWGITSYPDDTTLKANLLENAELSLKSALENSNPVVVYKSLYE